MNHLGATILAGLLLLITTSTARAGDADDEKILRGAIIAAAKDAGAIRFYIDLMGRPARAKLLAADDDGVEAAVSGNTLSLRWHAIIR